MYENGQFILFSDQDSINTAILNEEISYMLRDTSEYQYNISFEILSLSDVITYKSSFALQKDSEFTQLFNYHIAKMDETGVLDALRLSYFPKTIPRKTTSKSKSLGFDNVLFPFIILCGGIFIAVTLNVMEKCETY